MVKKFAPAVAAVAALVCAGSLRAHHAGSMFDSTPIWLTGTVVHFENVNPHTITTLEETREDGQIFRWAVEGPGASQLYSRGLSGAVPQVGDAIGFCAFAYKSAQELSRIFPRVDFSTQRSLLDADGLPLQYVTGHVLVMPDGQKQLWGAQGKLGECIRSGGDPRQSWPDFLNTNPRAREVWCEQQKATQQTELLRAVVAEMNSSLVDPCD